jgi:2-oxoglutarate dehydrogenase E1 component
VHLSLTANPSHLEIVDPGRAGQGARQAGPDLRRKREEIVPIEETAPRFPLLIHGDAAFAGQGVVAECFGCRACAATAPAARIHFIINNQIGFTTNPASRAPRPIRPTWPR